MRFLNKYLVVALFVIGLLVGGGVVVDSRCAAAEVCPVCHKEHPDGKRCEKTVCPQCGKTHDGKCASVREARGGKGATFKAAFTGAQAARVGNLTAGLSIIQSQAANMVSRNFTPYTYQYRGGYRQ